MNSIRWYLFCALLLGSIFTSCNKDKVDPNQPPTANAGPDQTAQLGVKVTLDGSASKDPENATIKYSWTVKTKPTDSQVSLANSTTVKPDFTPDKVGTYVAVLIVTDPEGLSATDEVSIMVNLPGAAPTARPGNSLTATWNTSVALDGSASSDPDNNPLTYKWEFKTRPTNSNPNLSITTPTQAKAAFTPDVPGQYVLTLTVSDNIWPAVSADVTVTANEGTAITTCTPVTAVTTFRNVVYDPAKPDYIICGDLAVNQPLTVDPGVLVYFSANWGLSINKGAALIAKGTATQPIRFTGEQQTPGFWKGIAVYSNDTRNEMEYVEVSYGGSSKFINQVEAANVVIIGDETIGLSAARLSMTNCLVQYSKGRGVMVDDDGIIGKFTNNTLSNNAASPIMIPVQEIHKLDAVSKFSNSNGQNNIEVYGDEVNLASEVTWPAFADGTKYRFRSISLNDNMYLLRSGVRIQEGAVFEFDADVGIQVGSIIYKTAYLIAKGTATKRIVFSGATKAQGAWKGIAFYTNNAQNELDFCEVSYGGSSNLGRGSILPYAANVGIAGDRLIGVDGARAKITNTIISNSLGFGIFNGNGTVFLLDTPDSNTYQSNKSGNIGTY